MRPAGLRARFLGQRGTVVGLALVFVLLGFAVLWPWLSSHDPFASDFERGIEGELPVGPSREFWLGTDRIYRDQLVRLAYGARLSLLIGLMATAIASVIGGAVGIVAGYFEGGRGLRVPWLSVAAFVASVAVLPRSVPFAVGLFLAALAGVLAAQITGKAPLGAFELNLDQSLMSFVDVGLSFPFMLLVMAVGASFEHTSVTTILVTLGLTGWLGTARIVRAKTLEVRNREFVMAARALGQSTPRILVLHVLPNVRGPLLAIATLSVAQMILAESVLSYVGAGVSPPTPTWGHMLFEGQEVFGAAPWLFFGPAGFILVAVFGFNLLGEGLRHALDRSAR